MDYPKFIVSNQKEESTVGIDLGLICLQRLSADDRSNH